MSARLAGRERDRRVDAGAHVEARGAGGRIGGQLRADPLVEDLDVEFFHQEACLMGVTVARGRARLEERGGVRDDAVGDLRLRRARERMRARVVVDRDLVLFLADGVLHEVRDDHRDLLLRALGLRVVGEVLALGGEAHAERARSGSAATYARMSSVGFSLSSSGSADFLSLRLDGWHRRVVGDGGDAEEESVPATCAFTALNISAALVT